MSSTRQNKINSIGFAIVILILILSSCSEDKKITGPKQFNITEGIWTGVEISFRIRGNYIEDLKIGPINYYGFGFSGTIETEFKNKIEISNNSFDFSTEEWNIKGTFVSADSSHGNYSYSGVRTSGYASGNWIATSFNKPPTPVILEEPDVSIPNSVILTWSENKDPDFLKYEVHASDIKDFAPKPETIKETITSRWTNEFTIISLTELKSYYFKILVVDKGNLLSSSNEIKAIIPLAQPTSLKVEVSDSQITLTWNDNSSSETGYKIERTQNEGSYTLLANVYANNTSYVDDSLPVVELLESLSYRVKAYKDTIESTYSNEVTLKYTLKITEYLKLQNVRGYEDQLAFHPNSELLGWRATSSLRILDITTKQIIIGTEECKGIMGKPIDFDPLGKLIVTSSTTFSNNVIDSIFVDIWDFQSLAVLRTIAGYTSKVNNLAFNYDGTILATDGFEDRSIHIWDTNNGTQLKTLSFNSSLRNIIASPTESIFAITPHMGKTILWDATNETILYTFAGYFLCFNSGGNKIAYYYDDHIIILDLSTGSEFLKIPLGPLNWNNKFIVFHPIFDVILAINKGAMLDVSLFSAETGEFIGKDRFYNNTFGVNSFKSISCSPNGKYLAVGVAYDLIIFSINTTWKAQ